MNKEDTVNWLHKNKISGYTLVPDAVHGFVVDVRGGIKLKEPCPVKFRRVEGHVEWFGDLQGAPDVVVGDFVCNGARLVTLTGAPKEVGGHFICCRNNLTNLVGAPQTVGGEFWCTNNKLTSLFGAPASVKSFYCHSNLLTGLEFAPTNVRDTFNCANNQITSLVGAPQKLFVKFNCAFNQIKDLTGGPITVGCEYVCNDNVLTSLLGIAKSRVIYCEANPALKDFQYVTSYKNLKNFIEASSDRELLSRAVNSKTSNIYKL